jgi:hypothetical protein
MDDMTRSTTIFLPATGDKPAEPAPYVLTEAEAVRLLRLDGVKDAYQALKRYRAKGWLKGVQLGNHVRYALPDVVEFIEAAKLENPR